MQIKRMDRIAQLVIVPVMVPEFTVVDSFGESASFKLGKRNRTIKTGIRKTQ
jgi:dUTPase